MKIIVGSVKKKWSLDIEKKNLQRKRKNHKMRRKLKKFFQILIHLKDFFWITKLLLFNKKILSKILFTTFHRIYIVEVSHETFQKFRLNTILNNLNSSSNFLFRLKSFSNVIFSFLRNAVKELMYKIVPE